LNARVGKKFIASSVIRLGPFMIMRRPIEFYRNSFRGAVEIKDVWAGAVLASELAVFELAVLQVFPQQCFGWREPGAQASAALLE
jgi:hypothetical protein